MPQFLYRIRPTRPAMLVEGPTEGEAEIVGQHFDYLRHLVDAGVVLMAGRTLNTDDSAFGIAVFVADSNDAAEALMRADPAVAQGVMSAELFPYRVALWSREGPQG
jgi:uncharacterized protein YciI